MTNWFCTQTRQRGIELVDHLKTTGPTYTNWWRIGAELGYPVGAVRTVVRDNPDRYGGTIQYIELGPTTHLIGFAWWGMPASYALRLKAAQYVTEFQNERRHRTRALADAIIADSLGDITMAEQSHAIYEIHRQMIA